jgi:myo-inositol-1(or 4)-monophosphatase
VTYKEHDYTRELDVAVRAAREAGRHIEERAENLGDLQIRKKGLNDLVTEVDEAAQRIIIRTLEETFPTYEVLAEEGDMDASQRRAEGYRWIIDPIDGTTNFTHGVPPYSVSIGLQFVEEIVVAVVLDISRDELFTAVRGNGLRVNGAPGSVSKTDSLSESLITTGFPYRSIDHVDLYLQVLGQFMTKSRGLRRPGSAAIDLAYVASGRFDGFFETGLLPWDVAAGLLLVEEGGGRVTDYRDRQNPVFAGQLLATNGNIHAEMLGLVKPMQDVYQ